MSKFSMGHISAAKVTPSMVLEMRELYRTNRRYWTQRRLADRYDITSQQVGRILRGESWRQYKNEAHPDEIEHSQAQAILGSTPEIPMDQETIEKLQKELAALETAPPMPGMPSSIDEVLKPKDESK